MKTVQYTTSTRLPCTCAEGFNTVILCLGLSDLLLPITCYETGDESPYPFSTLSATITQQFENISTSCAASSWTYTFEYDNDLLLDPDVGLIAADITGVFCFDCRATWAYELAGNDVYIRSAPDTSQTLVNQHGCEYPIGAGQQLWQLGLSNIIYKMPAVLGAPGDALRIQSIALNVVTLEWSP